MWAWGFALERLLPSAVVMLTTYAIVLGVIAVFRVKSPNARIALLLLPLFKSLFALVLGVPDVTLTQPVTIFLGVKLPDIDRLASSDRGLSDRFIRDLTSISGDNATAVASWAPILNVVFWLLAVAVLAIVAYKLAHFLAFYRRVASAHDSARDSTLRGTAERTAQALRVSLPKVVVLDVQQTFVPFTMGWRRPVVVLPRRLLDPELLSDPELASILAHEFAHIKRLDYLLNWLFSVTDSLLFFNPLTRRVVSRAYEATEEACDGLAARTTGEPTALVDALVRIARETREGDSGVRKLDPRIVPANVQAQANTLMSGRHLKERILRLETGETLRVAPAWLRVVKTIPMALCWVLVLVVQISVAIPVRHGLFFLQ